METYSDDFVAYDETHTYFKVVASPLVAIMVEGGMSQITLGWDQVTKHYLKGFGL